LRIAAISDIHGNLPAFESVLEHVNHQSVDQIVIVGDMVMGAPDSLACWELALGLNCPIVRGNCESFVIQFGTSEGDPSWETEQYGPLQWTVKEFTDQQRRSLSELPLTYRLPETSNLLFCHSSPRSEWDSIRTYTPRDQLDEMFEGVFEKYIVRGHRHNPQVHLVNGRVITNCGSIGLPEDGNTTAQYLILEQDGDRWDIQHQSVEYDVEAALQRFHDSGYLESTGPVGRLFLRHVATATQQVVPFVNHYQRWCAEGEISLSDALDRFLNMY
jgi:predicted phosphodiesterase